MDTLIRTLVIIIKYYAELLINAAYSVHTLHKVFRKKGSILKYKVYR